MRWSARRRFSSPRRRDASSGTSTRHCAVCTGPPRRSASASSVARTSTSTVSTRCRTRGCASRTSSARKMGRSSPKAALFWPLLAAVLALDVTTKSLAVAYLAPQYVPHEVLGESVRLTLAYNAGASFGIGVGPYSRIVFIVLALLALVILGRLYRSTAADDRARAASV